VNRSQVAARGESLARRHLEGLGYRVEACNWRAPQGEIDLVASDGETLVFVEVKARTGRQFGEPEEAITRRKRRHLLETAQAYLEAHDRLDAAWRIDVIAVDLAPSGAVLRLEHYQDAVCGYEPDRR
jgi:putative endonuclease